MILSNVIRTHKFKSKLNSNSYIHRNMIGIFEVEILLLFITIHYRELHFVITAVVEINFHIVAYLCIVTTYMFKYTKIENTN